MRAIYENGRVKREEFQAVGRLGGISYTRVIDEFQLAIPEVTPRK